MKTPLVFLAGAGVGALAMWLAMPKAASPATGPGGGETARNEARQGGSHANDASALPSKTERPTVAAKDNDDGQILDEDSPELREFRESVVRELTERRARRLDERLAALKSRLNLDEATAAKVRALLENSVEEEDRQMEAVNGGESPSLSAGELARKRAALDESVAMLLSPAQATAYEEFTAEQKENRIEVATGQEMSRLQVNLTLTPDQKDKVYQALNALAAREEEDGRTSDDLDAKETEARRQARLDALRPILTPEQFAEYVRRAEEARQFPGASPDAGDGAGKD